MERPELGESDDIGLSHKQARQANHKLRVEEKTSFEKQQRISARPSGGAFLGPSLVSSMRLTQRLRA